MFHPSSNCKIKIFTWCLEGSTPPIKMVSSLHGLPPYNDFKVSPQTIYYSHRYNNYDQATHKVSPYCHFPQRKPAHQATHCPTTNFEPLSRGSVINLMLITVFDTCLTPRSSGAWVWAKILLILNVAPWFTSPWVWPVNT